MSDLILHHYPQSPFAEKMRLILGYKNLSWQSVLAPMIMPKPNLVALTGGYRRIPVLQIGADIYCDTALICDALEHRQPSPTLYPETQKGLARTVAQWADSTLFPVAMAYNFQPAGATFMFPDADKLKQFAADRAVMRNNAPRMPAADATATYRSYLRRIAHMLEHQSWLLGDQPSVADFSVYHALWFTRYQVPPVASILESVPAVLPWMNRMASIGHGTSTQMTADAALAIARDSSPMTLANEIHQDDHGIALGSNVVITAESFGLEPTVGRLVAATRTRYTLSREDTQVGQVHIHFPRIGFLLKKADPN